MLDLVGFALDIETVFDQDPQSVRILQGPVAARHPIVKDEPIKDLLGNINSSLIGRLLERRYGGDASKVPAIEYLRPKPTSVSRRTPGGVSNITQAPIFPRRVSGWRSLLVQM